ncbi:MAG: UbiA prenyltransferase family protein [Armatimonadota bacterium]
MWSSVIAALRCKQWFKNLLLIIAVIFAGQFGNTTKMLDVGVAIISFCFLSSSVYILNDLKDIEQDRLHPTKCQRPFASGKLSSQAGYLVAMMCLLLAITTGAYIGSAFLTVEALYLVLSSIYTYGGKHIVILDVLLIASGFVLRTYAGAVAANVASTSWLLSFTLMGSSLLGFCKRRSEINELNEAAISHRATLSAYDIGLLDQFISITASSCIITYGLYAIMSPTAARHQLLMLTIPIMLYGIFRYLYLVYRKDMGSSPELVFLEDRPLALSVIVFTAVAIIAFRY